MQGLWPSSGQCILAAGRWRCEWALVGTWCTAALVLTVVRIASQQEVRRAVSCVAKGGPSGVHPGLPLTGSRALRLFSVGYALFYADVGTGASLEA